MSLPISVKLFKLSRWFEALICVYLMKKSFWKIESIYPKSNEISGLFFYYSSNFLQKSEVGEFIFPSVVINFLFYL